MPDPWPLESCPLCRAVVSRYGLSYWPTHGDPVVCEASGLDDETTSWILAEREQRVPGMYVRPHP